MQEKDVVSKDLFKRITLDIARILLGLEVEQAEIVENGARGKQQILFRLLQKRYGPLPPRIQARLEAASIPELEAWAEQILDGLNLEQMFPDA
ncbi:hypothetical protein B1757_11515 [Acidithiobacillus marinus]|uniref:DUF4351 domain-containing protein n=1 Tax=Acidithiobacillus marinus TaxID=187490 RepID=A0A2I1DJ84_9PROT|nr:DUF4351 domain-containing protein [Acidithiobacillus marinus]PKY09923.1 hypothetical protein B1757_11515 [Acidithiobacillus marinus]